MTELGPQIMIRPSQHASFALDQQTLYTAAASSFCEMAAKNMRPFRIACADFARIDGCGEPYRLSPHQPNLRCLVQTFAMRQFTGPGAGVDRTLLETRVARRQMFASK